MIYTVERNLKSLSETTKEKIIFCLEPSKRYLAALEKCGYDTRIVESNPDLSTGRVPYHLCPPYRWQ